MAEKFSDISRRLRRAAEQRIEPVNLDVLPKMETLRAPGVEPLVDLSYVARLVGEHADKVNELVERANLLVEHNLLLENKLVEIARVLTMHTQEIAHNLERLIDVEEEKK